MSEQFKFPNGGYEVTVLRKQDILDCIDDNIIDKEIAKNYSEIKALTDNKTREAK